MTKDILRIFWFLLGIFALGLGIVGIFLPILPTVPFLLLAAIGFGKSSDKTHNWLISHQYFGPPILDWEKNGAISRRVKFYASVSMLASLGLAVALTVPLVFLAIQAVCLLGAAIFIWSRPEK